MACVRVKDAGGDSMTLLEVDGYRMSLSGPVEEAAEKLRGLPNLPCREDDIFICAPMKSGTHWLWEMVSMMCNGNTDTIHKSKIQNMLEVLGSDNPSDIPSPRVLNTHVGLKYLPKESIQKKCKVVLPLRNPKDVAVSHFHHLSGIVPYEYDGKWENFLQLFLDGTLEYNSWFDNVKEWEELIMNRPDLPIHVVYYEDLIENIQQELYRLGVFLGIENKDNLYKRIADKCRIENMKKEKPLFPDKVKSAFTFSLIKGDFSFYRKGQIGDWKNHFTVAQNELFDAVYAEKMKDSKLKFRYEYSKRM